MSVANVPTSADAHYQQVTNLEGTDYILTFDYNQRESCYYLSIATNNGDDLVVGIKLVANWPLLHKWADSRLPPGELVLIANTNLTDPAPGLAQIGVGQDFTLVYYSSSQLP